MTYKIVNIRADGSTRYWLSPKSPDTSWVVERAHNCKADMATRFWPRKRGWRVLDVRGLAALQLRDRGVHHYPQARWPSRVFPTEDAAVVYAIHMIHRQGELNLT